MSKILSENEVKKLLSGYGIHLTKESIAENAEEAHAIASHIGTPVAMKISSPDITHKSDIGGVMLNVNTVDVKSTFDKIISHVKKEVPQARIQGILIQQMAPIGHEVIAGIKKDAQFGHTIMFGLGGIFVEVYRDVSFRVAPIEKKDALEMIGEIRGYPILKGIRGRKPADINAIASVLVTLSEMAISENILELDINPLIVSENDAIAVDARAMIEKS